MKQDSISIGIDGEKLRALKLYMDKKDADLEREVQDQLQKLYEKYVPASVREYIQAGHEDTPSSIVSSKKQSGKSNVAPQKLPQGGEQTPVTKV